MKALAQQLCSLYLLNEVDVDRIYHEEIFLEQPGADCRMWQWMAGVNYFCTNGDGRWWQDHRIPGGLHSQPTLSVTSSRPVPLPGK